MDKKYLKDVMGMSVALSIFTVGLSVVYLAARTHGAFFEYPVLVVLTCGTMVLIAIVAAVLFVDEEVKLDVKQKGE